MPQESYDLHTRHLGRMYLDELKKLHGLVKRREEIGSSWLTSVELCAGKCDYQKYLYDEHKALTVEEFDARCGQNLDWFDI